MSPAALRLADAEDRDLAVSTFDRNLVVVAGAGTGKTTLLVERLLVAVGLDRLRLRDVAAVTFTEKAAGEMRERLAEGLERLASGVEGDPPRAADRARTLLSGRFEIDEGTIRRRASHALEELESATIATVHGFCAEILRSHPIEADLSPGFEVDAGERGDALFEEAWERFLWEELGPAATRGGLWERVAAEVPFAVAREVARAFARFALPAGGLDGRAVSEAASAALGGITTALADELEELLARAPGITGKPGEVAVAAVRALRRIAAVGPSALSAIREGEPELDRSGPPSKNKSVPEAIAKDLSSATGRALRFLQRLEETDDALVIDLLDAVRPFVERFHEALAARGLVGFDALLARTRDLLRDRPGVREKLKRRFSALLLDEFQDTDPIQYEIVLFLAEVAGDSAADPFAARLTRGKLFIVGDPKQSIYRFRGADYSAFTRAVERVVEEGGRELRLTANFRSEPALLDPVNRLFAAPGTRIWAPSDVQPDYLPVTAGREGSARPGARVEILTVDPGPRASAETRRVAEGRVLAAEILRLAREDGVPFRDVFVLFRSFSNLPLYLRALREARIPFVVDGGKTFFERTEVRELLAALRALAMPEDPVAILAWLRSSAGAVSDAELAAWAAEGGRLDAGARPDPERFPRLAGSLARLAALSEETHDLPADRVVDRVLRATGLLPLGAFAYEGAQRVANLRKLASEAAALARDGSLSLGEILEALAARRGSEVESESPLADERTDAVRLLTIHKAKGLEAEVVFLPDLARGHSRRGSEDDPETSAIALGPVSGAAIRSRSAGLSNLASLLAEDETRRHEEAEEVRLLYVAATRARERLLLLAGPPSRGTEPPWLDALEAWGYDRASPPGDGDPLADGTVRHRLVPVPETIETLPSAAAAPSLDAISWEEALARARRAAAGCAVRTPSALAAGEDRFHGEDDATGREVARAVGTAFHALLERWPALGPDGVRRDGGAAARCAAAEAEADPEETAAALGALLDVFLAGPFPGRLRALDVLAREIPILGRLEDGALVKGVADILYRDGDGALVVADWKTDASEEGAVERYGAQLRAYAEAVARAAAPGAPVRAELWMARTGRVLPVPHEERGR